MKFLIYNLIDCAGLTTDINEAGVYRDDEAFKLCFDSNRYVNRDLPPSAALIPIEATPKSRGPSHIPTKTLPG
jgi:hypothetical protein